LPPSASARWCRRHHVDRGGESLHAQYSREFINKNPTDKQESHMAKLVSLIVKAGALVFILFVPTQYAIQLQLLGGIWIIQTLPAVMLGAYTRWFNSWRCSRLGGRDLCGHRNGHCDETDADLPAARGRLHVPGYTAVTRSCSICWWQSC